jgi:ferric enterobactin receptor
LQRNKAINRIELIPKRLYLPMVMVAAGSSPLFEMDAEHAHLVFNPNDIISSDGLGESDIFRMSQMLPGVSSNQENSGGLLIRGGNSDQTLMQLDGFTIYHQDHLFGMFSAVNSQAVKNVRLHKSTPHSRIGGRIGGLLEMVGKEGNTQQGVTQINVGMLSGALSVEGPLDTAGQLGFIFNGRRAYTDGWFSPTYRRIFSTVYNGAIISADSTQNKTFDSENIPSYFFQDANIKLTYKPTNRHTLHASTYVSRDQLYIHYADTAAISGNLMPKVLYTDESQWKNSGASLQFLYHPLPSEHVMARMTISEYDASYFSTDTVLAINQVQSIRIQNTETTLRNVKITTEKQWAKVFHTISIGAESERVISVRDQAYRIEERPQQKNSTWWHSIYVQDDWSASLRWRIHGGFRATWDKNTHRLLSEPRATIVYRWPLRRIRFELGYARLHQLIHRLREQNLYQNNPDYWALSNNDNIPVLTSHQINTGVHKDFNKGHVHLDFFSRQNQGSTLFLGSLPGYDQSQIKDENLQLVHGQSQSYGFELSAFFQKKNHQLLASYTWLTSNSEYAQLDNQKINANHEHRHEAKIYYEWQSRHWSYGLFWTYGSGRPYTPIVGTYSFTFPNNEQSQHVVFGNFNSKRLPAYHRLDLSIKYHWSSAHVQWELGASIYNFYNRMNIRSRQYFLTQEENNIALMQSNLNMLGFVPSIQMQIRF